MSLGSSAFALSLSIETSRSPSFGRSLAGCARAGMASIARFNPTADTVVRKPRRVGFSLSFIWEATDVQCSVTDPALPFLHNSGWAVRIVQARARHRAGALGGEAPARRVSRAPAP